MPQESKKTDTNESEIDKTGSLPKTHLRLKELLLQIKDTRLSEEEKRIERMVRGKFFEDVSHLHQSQYIGMDTIQSRIQNKIKYGGTPNPSR